MGAKSRLLEGFIEREVGRRLPAGGRGLFVDLFAGTGAVAARFVGAARVHANDVQRYSATLTRALVDHDPDGGTRRRFAAAVDPDRDLGPARDEARDALSRRYARALAAEDRFLGGGDVARYRAHLLDGGAPPADPEAELGPGPGSGPDRLGLATAYYRNVYFGVAQAVALDSLRVAIERLDPRDPFAARKRTHYLAALLFAASRATSGTAHFAQPRGLAKESEVSAVMERRSIDIDRLFRLRAAHLAAAVARTPFAAKAGPHRVFELDYPDLFALLDSASPALRPDVVYADPPYTADHYSRFYHVLETLARHDFPALERRARTGAVLKGRYPVLARRFQSSFSHPNTVEGEFRRVLAWCAARGVPTVIWSYSLTNGILVKHEGPFAGERLRLVCGAYYRRVTLKTRALRHSGQGDKNHDAEEVLAICEGPR